MAVSYLQTTGCVKVNRKITWSLLLKLCLSCLESGLRFFQKRIMRWSKWSCVQISCSVMRLSCSLFVTECWKMAFWNKSLRNVAVKKAKDSSAMHSLIQFQWLSHGSQLEGHASHPAGLRPQECVSLCSFVRVLMSTVLSTSTPPSAPSERITSLSVAATMESLKAQSQKHWDAQD